MKITINEKEYGLVWGLAAIDRYCTLVDMEVEPAFDLVFKGSGIKQSVALAKFVSCAIESYSLLNHSDADVSYEQILSEFDTQGISLIQAILSDFLQSKLLGQTVSEFLGLVVEETNKVPGKTKKKQAQVKS
jgi:hypothetical protein